MAVFPQTVDKLSVFRHRNIIKYLQCIQRSKPSLNTYSYTFEYIDKFMTVLREVLTNDHNFPEKIWEAYNCIFSEIAMCDNYVKLSLIEYQRMNSFTHLQMIQSIEYSISYFYELYLNYRESLYDQAELLLEYTNSTILDENAHINIQAIYNNIYQLINLNRPVYGIEQTPSESIHIYTPYNISIEDIASVWFENIQDYKYILQRCQNTELCNRILQNNIKRIKDLYYTFYSAGIQVIYDLSRTDQNEITNTLSRKISQLLLLDIGLRDCQSKQQDILTSTDTKFHGHLQWRQTIWNDSMTLYDISLTDNINKLPYISTIFNSVLSNINNKHRDQILHSSLTKMKPEELISALIRFIPN